MNALLVLALLLGAPQTTNLDESAEPSPRSKREVEFLMSEGVPFAERLMRKDGEFVPFGAVMLRNGLIQTVGTPEEADEATAEGALERLLRDFRVGAASGQYKATALFVNVRVRHPADGEMVAALQVALEHRDGYCVDVFYPYVGEAGTMELGEPFAGRRPGAVFDGCR